MTAMLPINETAVETNELLRVESVRVQFGKLRAVDDVSFTLSGGSLLGLIGPNGAGKTTLLRTIVGLQPIHRGVVSVMGEPVQPGRGNARRFLGFTADTPGVYEELTVRNFLRFVARGYDIEGPELNERIDFWLEKVWLIEKADAKIKQLSRGMRQRIGIARTLLPNPSVVLLDEPAAGLDPAGRVQFRQLLCDLREQGKALIVSSHILSDMSDYCTHIGIMRAGAMIQYGTVNEIAAGTVDDRCRYTITLARPVTRIADTLGAIDGMGAVAVERDRVVFEFHADRVRAADLLTSLVRAGLPIASFAPNQSGLEEAYLRTGIRQVD